MRAPINALTKTRRLEGARGWSAVPLRLIVGCGFIAHGYAKVVNGPAHFAASLHGLGVPAPHAMAWTTIAIEFVGGLAVLLGAWIPVDQTKMGAMSTVAGGLLAIGAARLLRVGRFAPRERAASIQRRRPSAQSLSLHHNRM